MLTGIGGDGWVEAAKALSRELGLDIAAHVIGPRQPWQDLTGEWAALREVRDGGVLLVRPDQHVCWRSQAMAADPEGALRQALRTVLSL